MGCLGFQEHEKERGREIEALQYLANRYTADEFKEETIWPLYGDERDLSSFRKVVIETVRIWKEALRHVLKRRELSLRQAFVSRNAAGRENCQYFSSYEKAWEYLLKEKQEYLDDEDLKYVKTFASIERIKLDDTEGSDGKSYLFDNEMRMVNISVDCDRAFAGRGEFTLADEYLVYVPLLSETGIL